MDNNNFTILNNRQPTYTHHNGTRSHLDLSIVCHTFATKGDWDVLPDTLGSDHSPIVTYINIQVTEEIDDTKKFILYKADWESLKINSRKLLTAI